ncbi:MAG: L,D-transpeptidase family protein [Chloroflexi bacterium]|nr:L,D-transpeptidase family protein [Chloroflexota bacterium]
MEPTTDETHNQDPLPEGAPRQAAVETDPLAQVAAEAAASQWAAARALLHNLLSHQPDCTEAWVWLAALSDNTWEAVASLSRALELEPRHHLARAGLRWAQERLDSGESMKPMEAPFARRLLARAPQTPPPAPTPEAAQPSAPAEPAPHRPQRSGWLGRGALVLGTAVLLGIVVLLGNPLTANHNDPSIGPVPVATTPAPPAPLPPTPTPPASQWALQQQSAAQEAGQGGRWAEAIPLWEELVAMNPADALARESLLQAYLQQARTLVSQGLLDEALLYVDRAMAVRPNDERVQRERLAAQLYMEGMQNHQAADWAAAAQALQRVFDIDPAYRDVGDMLFSAYFNLGLAQRAAGEQEAARGAFGDALRIQPESAEAQASYEEMVIALIPTPSPTPGPDKRIEVDISEQRFYAYEDDVLIHNFIASTGSNASPTAPGNYSVLDKIPMAYASTWNLQMPYWMGIYWSGGLENGIHALPILSSGQLLWDGYLGQRVSFGCVILSTEAAEIIYNWADVGTPVIIRY